VRFIGRAAVGMLPRPAFDFPGAWFRLGAVQELHLIGRRGPVAVTDGNHHFALRVDDLAAWEKHLRAAGAECVSGCVRMARRKFFCATRTGISSSCFHSDRQARRATTHLF